MKDREEDGNLDNRIFVGGMWDVTEKQLRDAFEPCGKITECQIMMDKDTGRSRGFGFITFADRRGADDAIKNMHGSKVGNRVISVKKADPKVGGDDVDHSRKGGGYSSREKESYGRGAPAAADVCFKCGHPGHLARKCPSTGSDRGRFISVNKAEPKVGGDNVDHFRKGGGYSSREKESYGRGAPAAEVVCFKCGGLGHWARECPSPGSDLGRFRDPPTMRSRLGEFDGHRDGYGDWEREREHDLYRDERRDVRQHSNRDRFEGGYKYETRDNYPMERYAPPGDHRYGWHPEDDYGGRDRDRYGRGASDRYGGMGPLRNEGRAYRSRPGPYDRPNRGRGRSSSYERR